MGEFQKFSMMLEGNGSIIRLLTIFFIYLCVLAELFSAIKNFRFDHIATTNPTE